MIDPASTPSNVSDYLRIIAQQVPMQTAIIDPRGNSQREPRTITFAELEAEVELLARGLIALGIHPGQRLALLVPPSIEFIALVFALIRSRAVQILIDPGMGRANLIRCLSEAEPTGVISTPLGQTIRRVMQRCLPLASQNICVGSRGWWNSTTLNTVRDLGRQSTIPTSASQPDDPAAIIFTTGSTGPPKGVLFRQQNFLAQVELIRDQYGIAVGEIDVPCFPLFGLFNAAMGVTTVLPVMNFSRPASCSVTEITERAIVKHQATQSFASPAVWDKVGRACAEHPQQFNSLRRILSAGAPVNGAVLRRMVAALPASAEMHTPYGATEALPIATITAREVLSQTWSNTEQGAGVCVGRKFQSVEWRIIQITDGPIANIDDTVELPRGEIGELIVCGPMVTTEYVTRREANAMAKIADPRGGIWHRMGDAGYIDANERFWFCGRVAHRVITATRAYESVCVEEIANTHPLVRRTALVGSGPNGQQQPVLFIEPINMRRRWFGWRWPAKSILEQIEQEVRALLQQYPASQGITTIQFHPNFPVDIRHNAKIFREKLRELRDRQVASQ